MLENILLVEDEDYLRELIGMALQEFNCNITLANSGLEAIHNFYELGHIFDLLITDVTMPGLSGPELVKKIINYDKNFSKVIFITGLSELPFEVKELEKMNLKIKALFKPFFMSELMATILEMRKKEE